uniref:Uncharacterized protein n=1 Tax=Arundo donax TaxID=35708 RepID=A0A0A9BFC0_ARUDO
MLSYTWARSSIILFLNQGASTPLYG